MKNITVILIVFITVLIGCKSETGTDNDKSKSDLAFSGVGNLNSSGSNWTKKYKNQFLVGCIEEAVETISSAEAEKYCNCMAGLLEKKYPDESEVNARLTQDEIEKMRAECLGAKQRPAISNWSSADKQEFLISCSSKMKGSLGLNKAKIYCDCMANKIITQSPEVNSTVNITQAQLATWGTDCLK